MHPTSKLIPLFPFGISFNAQWVDNGNLTLAVDHGL